MAAGIAVMLFDNKTGEEKPLIVDRIINCTGPEEDITAIDEPLFNNLRAKDMLAPDDMKMGINADPETGALINAKGEISNTMYTIGGNLKGVQWESIAVPELR